MIVGVPKESYPGEWRVALVPGALLNLAKAGMQVIVEAGARESVGYRDAEYVEKGAKIISSRAEVFTGADIVAQRARARNFWLARAGGERSLMP